MLEEDFWFELPIKEMKLKATNGKSNVLSKDRHHLFSNCFFIRDLVYT